MKNKSQVIDYLSQATMAKKANIMAKVALCVCQQQPFLLADLAYW